MKLPVKISDAYLCLNNIIGPFWRQLLVVSGPWTCYFLHGLCQGTPTVLVPQLVKENQTISDDLASWLPTTQIYCGLPWILMLCYLIITVGRKKCQMLIGITSLIGFIGLYFCFNITHILITEIFLSVTTASYLTNSIAVLTEYTSSKYRGQYLIIKTTSYYWGLLAANTIGTFTSWKYIAVLGIVASVYTLINVLFWPESPYWLASKGRFEECATAHRWLKGSDEESDKELQKIFMSYEKPPIEQQWTINEVVKTLKQRFFIKPIGVSCILMCLYLFCGKTIISIFALEIFKKIMNGETAAYNSMLTLDAITVLTMYIGCYISKLFSRRITLFTFSLMGIVFLLLTSGYLFLVKISVLEDNNYVSITLLAAYSICISCGPVILSLSIVGELLPLEWRCLSMLILALLFKFVVGSVYKISPLCFYYLTIHGTFLLFGLSSLVFVLILYFILPETKDKTLLEISEFFSK